MKQIRLSDAIAFKLDTEKESQIELSLINEDTVQMTLVSKSRRDEIFRMPNENVTDNRVKRFIKEISQFEDLIKDMSNQNVSEFLRRLSIKIFQIEKNDIRLKDAKSLDEYFDFGESIAYSIDWKESNYPVAEVINVFNEIPRSSKLLKSFEGKILLQWMTDQMSDHKWMNISVEKDYLAIHASISLFSDKIICVEAGKIEDKFDEPRVTVWSSLKDFHQAFARKLMTLFGKDFLIEKNILSESKI